MKAETQTQLKRYEEFNKLNRETHEEFEKLNKKICEESEESNKEIHEESQWKRERDRDREADQLEIEQFTDKAYVNF